MIDCLASTTLRFEIQRHEDTASGTVIFQLSGPCTLRHMYNSISPMALRNILVSIPGNPGPAVHIFDLTRVPYMDYAGLRIIVDHYRHNRPKDIQIMATGVNPRVLDRFKSSRMEHLFPITTC
jgi:anti-anti-sigma factor